MTFATKVKNELCRTSKNNNGKCDMSLLYGILLFARNFRKDNISLYSENKNICELTGNIIINEFGCIVDIISLNNNLKTEKGVVILKIPDEKDRIKVLNKFGHISDEINLKINKNNFRKRADIKAFLRGAFMSCGTVTDPQNGYHLEFSVPFMNLSKSLYELLNSLNDIEVTFKNTTRKTNFIIYMKNSSDITDFLTYIGAPFSAMEMMQVKMVKEVRNYVNRTTNFETANISKTATASAVQIEAINKIKEKGMFNSLDDDLKELAQLRLDNPEMSLRELGENLSVPITRSGVNHKIKKILNIYNDI